MQCGELDIHPFQVQLKWVLSDQIGHLWNVFSGEIWLFLDKQPPAYFVLKCVVFFYFIILPSTFMFVDVSFWRASFKTKLEDVHKRIVWANKRKQKLDQGALGMSDACGTLQLALKPNSVPRINCLLSNFYFCANWSVVPCQMVGLEGPMGSW